MTAIIKLVQDPSRAAVSPAGPCSGFVLMRAVMCQGARILAVSLGLRYAYNISKTILGKLLPPVIESCMACAAASKGSKRQFFCESNLPTLDCVYLSAKSSIVVSFF